jgi:gliding motility-associated-like protein
VPNIITPNGDKKNDTFVPKVTCLPLSFKLFSRWGNLVHEEKNYSNDFNGEKLGAGIYYYLLKDSEGKTWKGWLDVVK